MCFDFHKRCLYINVILYILDKSCMNSVLRVEPYVIKHAEDKYMVGNLHVLVVMGV